MKRPWLIISLSKAGSWIIYSVSVALVALTGACRSSRKVQKTDKEESRSDRNVEKSFNTIDYRYFEGLGIMPEERDRILEMRVMYGVMPVQQSYESVLEKSAEPVSSKSAVAGKTKRDSLKAERDSLRRTLERTRNLVIYGPPEMLQKVGKELQNTSDRVDSISKILDGDE